MRPFTKKIASFFWRYKSYSYICASNKKAIQTMKEILVGDLREMLNYKTRGSFEGAWKSCFSEFAPNDAQKISNKDAVCLCEHLLKNKKGRPETITTAAASFLDAQKELDASPSIIPAIIEPPTDPEKEVVEVEKVIEEPKKEIQKEDKAPFFDVKHGGLNLSYYVTVIATCYGLIFLLKVMGIAPAVVYTLVSLQALEMAKDRKSRVTAQRGIAAVWILEILAFFVHLTMFNYQIWSGKDTLPFEVESGEYRIFIIALIFGMLFSAAGIYAVSTRLALTVESADAEDFEAEHNRKY